MGIDLYRRHLETCKHADKGAGYTKCACPIWAYGRIDGLSRPIRKSTGLRDWARAVKRVEQWEAKPDTVAFERTIADCIAAYVADCRARNLAGSTIISYQNILAGLREWCSAREIARLDAVTLDDLTQYRGFIPGRTTKAHFPDCPAARKRAGRRHCGCPVVTYPVSAKTTRKVIECLRAFWAFAVDRGWAPLNIARKIKPPIDDACPTLPFTREEVSALVAACDSVSCFYTDGQQRARVRAKALVLLLLYSGLRISDAVQLRRDHVDMRTGRLLIRIMKTGVPLYTRLHPDAVAALAALPAESPHFFWSGVSELDTAVKSARRTIDCLCRMTGIKGHPHRFRDTCAVALLTCGEDIRTVQLILGHSSLKTTEKHYAPWVASMQKRIDDAASKLDFTSYAPGTLALPQM